MIAIAEQPNTLPEIPFGPIGFKKLNLTEQEKSDLVEYLKSL